MALRRLPRRRVWDAWGAAALVLLVAYILWNAWSSVNARQQLQHLQQQGEAATATAVAKWSRLTEVPQEEGQPSSFGRLSAAIGSDAESAEGSSLQGAEVQSSAEGGAGRNSEGASEPQYSHSAAGVPGIVSLFGSGAALAARGSDLQCPPLSKELVERHAKASASAGPTVLLGLLNGAQLDFGVNWIAHLQRIGLSYLLVGAVDRNASAFLARAKVPCFDYGVEAVQKLGLETDPSQPGGSADFVWGKEGWRRVVWLKVFVLEQIVDWGFSVVYSDADVIWLRDPLPLFDRHPHADLLFSTDHCFTKNGIGDDGLEINATMNNHNWNTGVYMLRRSPMTLNWVRAWRGMFASAPTLLGLNGIQPAAYKLTRQGPTLPHAEDARLTTAWNGSLNLGIVPAFLFASGHTYTVQRLHERMGWPPYAMHLTWTYNGAAGKKARARDAMLWFDGRDYYEQSSFVTVDLPAVQAPVGYNSWGRDREEDMVQFHLSTLQAQLSQATAAMAVAAASGRAFISPKFTCYCERMWHAVLRCRHWDAQDLQLPITCPTDYLFEPSHFSDDPQSFGTPLDFREPTFLDNPRTPAAIKDSVLVIRPTLGLKCTDCVLEQKLDSGGTLVLIPSGLRDKALRRLLEPYVSYRVWRLSLEGVARPEQAFGCFSCASAARQFDKRMEHITGIWCCRWKEQAAKYKQPESVRLRMGLTYAAMPGLEDC